MWTELYGNVCVKLIEVKNNPKAQKSHAKLTSMASLGYEERTGLSISNLSVSDGSDDLTETFWQGKIL